MTRSKKTKKTKKIKKLFLNGKEVTSEVISKRKDKTLTEIVCYEHLYYTSPLTKQEQEEKRKQDIIAMNYFERMREDREELERRHG